MQLYIFLHSFSLFSFLFNVLSISNGPYIFETKGTFIDFDGFLRSYPYKDDGDDEESFPSLKLNEEIKDSSMAFFINPFFLL